MKLLKHYLQLFLLLLAVSASHLSFGQENPELAKKLDSVGVLDQKFRTNYVEQLTKAQQDSMAQQYEVDPERLEWRLWKEQQRIDSSNLVFIEKVIEQHGYPGKSLVGESAAKVTWLIIQHNPPIIGKYLPIIKSAAKAGEIPFTLAAMMEDRYLMNQGKEQIYGTQGSCDYLSPEGETHGGQETEPFCYIWPVKDPEGVNQRRKEAGFTQTVEEYARDLMDIEYKVLKLEDVQKENH